MHPRGMGTVPHDMDHAFEESLCYSWSGAVKLGGRDERGVAPGAIAAGVDLRGYSLVDANPVLG